MAPAMGKAQPARAMSVPVIVAAPGTGSRVQKSTAALKSAASWLSEMTGDIACPCVNATLPVLLRRQDGIARRDKSAQL
jgi:hypothetical protein